MHAPSDVNFHICSMSQDNRRGNLEAEGTQYKDAIVEK